MFKQILLAIDGSSGSDAAARLALSFASANSARLTVLYVIEPYPYPGAGDTDAAGTGSYLSSARRHGLAVHAKGLTECKGSGVSPELEMREGAPAREILQAAAEDEVDLIVLGNRGCGAFDRAMLGSVAMKVIARSHVPVLVACDESPGERLECVH